MFLNMNPQFVILQDYKKKISEVFIPFPNPHYDSMKTKPKHLIRPSHHQNMQRHSRHYLEPRQQGMPLFFSGGHVG